MKHSLRFHVGLGVLLAAFVLVVGCDGAKVDAPDDNANADDDDDAPCSSACKDAAKGDDDDEPRPSPKDAAASKDAGGAGQGEECFFNADCKAALRCECDEATGCSCQTGVRGTGEAGASCADGNDCASSICIDETTCSAACDTEQECPAALPQCIFVFGFPKKICAPDN